MNMCKVQEVHPPQVVGVAKEVDGHAVLPDDDTQVSPVAEFISVTFGQPLASSLG